MVVVGVPCGANKACLEQRVYDCRPARVIDRNATRWRVQVENRFESGRGDSYRLGQKSKLSSQVLERHGVK